MNIAAKGISILALIFFATGCTTPEKARWNQPASGTGPKPSDLAVCRADANRRAEREFLLDTNPRGGRGYGAPVGLDVEMARRDAKRYRQRIYDECLRSLGYSKVPSGR